MAKNGDCIGSAAVITDSGNSLASPHKAPFLSQRYRAEVGRRFTGKSFKNHHAAELPPQKSSSAAGFCDDFCVFGSAGQEATSSGSAAAPHEQKREKRAKDNAS